MGLEGTRPSGRIRPFHPLPVEFKNCVINIDKFESLLANHPNKFLIDYITSGLRFGFDIGFTGPFTNTRPKNNKSACNNKKLVQDAIDKEVTRGHTSGPFPYPPFPDTHCSPIGSAPKKDGTARLVMDLSQPHGSAINDHIDKEQFSASYSHFDEALDLLNFGGRGSLLAKLDIKHAYRLLPVRPDQWHHLCYCWEDEYYVDTVLPFGLRSSAGIFNQFARLVRWILQTHYNIDLVTNYSDDFFFVLSSDMTQAKEQLATIIQAFHDLGIPLADDKIEGPALSLIYLGILINSENMTMEVTPERLSNTVSELRAWVNMRTCTKRQLKSLIGKLSFISKVVRPGRMFSRRLIDLSTTVEKMHHHISLNKNAKADLQWWLDFLPTWSTKSVIPQSLSIFASDIKLFTDSSDKGYGAIYGSAWIQGPWSAKEVLDLSIDFRELFAIVAASFTWGHCWSGKRIVFTTDNKPITQVWASGASPSPQIMSLIRPLFLFAARNSFSISFKHIFGVKNPIADAILRFQMSTFRQLMPDADPLPTSVPGILTSMKAYDI